MKKLAIFAAAAALLLTGVAPVLADGSRSRESEWRQSGRVDRDRGKLTPSELRRLAQQQRRIDRARERAYSDGYVSPAERRQLELMRDRAPRTIWRKSYHSQPAR